MYLRWMQQFRCGVVDPSEGVIDCHRTKHGTYILNWNPLHHASWKQPFKKNSKAIAQPNHWPINQRKTTKSIKQGKPNKKIRRTKTINVGSSTKTQKKHRQSKSYGHDTTMMTEANQGKIELHTFWGKNRRGRRRSKIRNVGFLFGFKKTGSLPRKKTCIMYIFQKANQNPPASFLKEMNLQSFTHFGSMAWDDLPTNAPLKQIHHWIGQYTSFMHPG